MAKPTGQMTKQKLSWCLLAGGWKSFQEKVLPPCKPYPSFLVSQSPIDWCGPTQSGTTQFYTLYEKFKCRQYPQLDQAIRY